MISGVVKFLCDFWIFEFHKVMQQYSEGEVEVSVRGT